MWVTQKIWNSFPPSLPSSVPFFLLSFLQQTFTKHLLCTRAWSSSQPVGYNRGDREAQGTVGAQRRDSNPTWDGWVSKFTLDRTSFLQFRVQLSAVYLGNHYPKVLDLPEVLREKGHICLLKTGPHFLQVFAHFSSFQWSFPCSFRLKLRNPTATPDASYPPSCFIFFP